MLYYVVCIATLLVGVVMLVKETVRRLSSLAGSLFRPVHTIASLNRNRKTFNGN
ncbi:hypothetical protein B4113_1638 [Geobacillus sp. B4113_201601]|nr:hypothetical protein B4113_1638 [Geobacillus sp. B4113_201601]